MGKMKVDQIPWTQPTFAPLYDTETFPATTYENWQLVVTYETDGEFVENALPEGVDFATDPPTAVAWCIESSFTTIGGPHREMALGVVVKYEGKEYLWPLTVYLGPGTEEFFATGREIWGHQKKFGYSGIVKTEGSGIIQATLERPKGMQLMNLSAGPFEKEAAVEDLGFLPVLALRVIPHSDRPKPQIAELTVTELEMTPKKMSDGHLAFWSGPGQVAFPVHSDRDPLYRVPVRRVISAYYGCFERIHAPLCTVLKTLIP